MPTLHIEHPITDLKLWNEAFERFAEVRARYGVRAQRVQQPVDDAHYIVIDLDFDTADEASHFLGFLQANVWSSPGKAPALVGTPLTKILQPAVTRVEVDLSSAGSPARPAESCP